MKINPPVWINFLENFDNRPAFIITWPKFDIFSYFENVPALPSKHESGIDKAKLWIFLEIYLPFCADQQVNAYVNAYPAGLMRRSWPAVIASAGGW